MKKNKLFGGDTAVKGEKASFALVVGSSRLWWPLSGEEEEKKRGGGEEGPLR